MKTADAVFVYSLEEHAYQFHEKHPFNPLRLELTKDLLEACGSLEDGHVLPPRKATNEEIALVHDQAFIDAVQMAGSKQLSAEKARSYGLGTDDTPFFKGMHDAASFLVGGTLTAVDAVMSGSVSHALHLGGGLHHGFKGKASGFCIYNDSSIAIEYIKQKYKARVMYIDTDAHHGDGVQWSFYDDPDVFTLSIHETGRYLFPGTGSVTEKGAGEGYGFKLNIPLEAFTEDDSFLESYETAFREAIEFFKPDVILTQNGADSHYLDPLTHLHTSLKSFQSIPKLAHELAHTYCEGRWIAVGGGGYDHWRVVPRAWASIWLEMTNQTHISQLPIPSSWIDQWQEKADVPLPYSWGDPAGMLPEVPRKSIIETRNQQTVDKALYYIRNEKRFHQSSYSQKR
ncbi:acetoin utilization protein AcuC [Alkalicoccobacillus murimartini]|uniref:Acetoin utilization protein AcuC n=1 Tax=Alkalicoccobacillus murimartini TaxID=171685 RepID=A0ABT9YK91_9BACI|nr:acetoin utilization protein AcuC [Alkalicoccobacillus murimartini]MDQ0208151.1 acetoin utilization protein AcuC [Alkalicoccobacillus murimartini]